MADLFLVHNKSNEPSRSQHQHVNRNLDLNDEIKRRQRLEWRAAAPGWKKWDERLVNAFQPVSDKLIRYAGIAPGNSVLDVATGTGEPALTIARIIGSQGTVVGVDLPGYVGGGKRTRGRPRSYERDVSS